MSISDVLPGNFTPVRSKVQFSNIFTDLGVNFVGGSLWLYGMSWKGSNEQGWVPIITKEYMNKISIIMFKLISLYQDVTTTDDCIR